MVPMFKSSTIILSAIIGGLGPLFSALSSVVRASAKNAALKSGH